MKTIVIQIGNSDNKLSQSEWATFAGAVRLAVSTHVNHIHFSGGSDWDAPWQNACFVCEVTPETIEMLKANLIQIRSSFQQDSIAFLTGEVEFI